MEEKGGVRLFHLFDDDFGEEADAIGQPFSKNDGRGESVEADLFLSDPSDGELSSC